MLTIGLVLTFVMLAEASTAYLAYEGLAALQSSVNTPERIVTAIPALRGVVTALAAVVMIASLWGLWRLRKNV